MLLWLHDIAVTRADLLNASVPRQNTEDAFVVADTQKSDLRPEQQHHPPPARGTEGLRLPRYTHRRG